MRMRAPVISGSNLPLEEVRSEMQRSALLIIAFASILTIAVFNFAVSSAKQVAFYGGVPTFLSLIGFMTCFLGYEVLIFFYLKARLKHNQRSPVVYKFIHAVVEISFPSAMVFYMLYHLKMLSFLDSPIVLVYFLIIILSVLHLDFKVNIFSGIFAGLQYAGLTYYGFNAIDVPPEYTVFSQENLHYVRALILVLGGGAAAFVSAELKHRVKLAFTYQQARNEMEHLFGQQVSREVSRALIEENGVTRRREATIMFLDIRNFTNFADNHSAEEVVDYQNKFLAPVIDIINQHQGVVFQILGDGLMACFGAPGENVLHADMAFQASMEILRRVKRASEEAAIPNTTIGIGLHSGMIVTGNIGNEQRKQFSISGTPVIIASRIEQLNKKFGTQFLISGDVFQRITAGRQSIFFLGEESLRGIGEPVKVYQVV